MSKQVDDDASLQNGLTRFEAPPFHCGRKILPRYLWYDDDVPKKKTTKSRGRHEASHDSGGSGSNGRLTAHVVHRKSKGSWVISLRSYEGKRKDRFQSLGRRRHISRRIRRSHHSKRLHTTKARKRASERTTQRERSSNGGGESHRGLGRQPRHACDGRLFRWALSFSALLFFLILGLGFLRRGGF
ncbi:hypothetical protein GW17_00055038 [Ensete ventricosum]|nr:hypothetical protein GW17_00055038 [Ensete ventricosum]